MTPMICPKCGATLPATDIACPRCGTNVATFDRGPTVDLPPSAQATITHIATVDSATDSTASDESSVPRIGRFEIRQKLGEGAFGVVYRAFDPQLNREVALKVAKPAQLSTPERVQRFLREARSAANLRHPNIVQVFDAGQDGTEYFIAQGFIDGPSLDRVLRKQPDRRLDCEQAAGIVRKLAEALAYSHQRNIMHRDIKPANVLLEATATGTEPVLTDFGLAAPTEEGAERLTQDAGRVMGTPAFMAPEQGRGEASAASDQYSLGVTFYELLTGQLPYTGSALEQIVQHQSKPFPSPRTIVPSIPRDLETICLKCVEKESSGRYATCAELAEDLRRWRDGEPVLARRMGYAGRFGRWAKRNPGIAASLVMVFLSLALGAGFATRYGIRADEAREDEKKVAGELKTTLTVSEQRRIEAEKAKNAETKISSELKTTLGVSEQRRKELKQALRESKERLYLADLRLDSARLRNAQDQWEKGNAAGALVILNTCPWEMRGWEYAHLRSRFEQSDFTLRGHTTGVGEVGFSPDGTTIATVSADSSARVWDARTGELRLHFKGHSQPVWGVSFSPDGSHIATSSEDKTAKVWDARTGEVRLTLYAHTHTVYDVSFSPDGLHIATASEDGTANVWDARTGDLRFTCKGHQLSVNCVNFSPDGTRIVTGSSDRTTKVWDARTGDLRFTLEGHQLGVWGVGFSPDGKRVVTGSEDSTAKVWDAHNGELHLTLKGHTNLVTGVSFSRDGTRIVTGSHDRTARVWDARTGETRLTLIGHTEAVWGVNFSPDDGRIVTGSHDNTAKVWDARPGDERLTVREHLSPLTSIGFSPDGTLVVTGNFHDEAKVWDDRTGEERLLLNGHTFSISSVGFSPDGTLIVTGSEDKTAKVWDARTGAERLTFKGHTGFVKSVDFSPDGTSVVTGSADNTAKVWDARTGEERLTLKGHTDAVWCVSFSPDGTHIVTGSYDKTAKVWDARTGEARLTLLGHANPIWAVSFSPDGKRIATGGPDMTAKVWNARTGEHQLTLIGHTSGITSVGFSPDGTRIVTGSHDHMAKVWDAQTGEERLSLTGHKNWVKGVSFNPDGTRIVTASSDTTAMIWDARPWEDRLSRTGRTLTASSVRFTRDGTRIVTANADGTKRVWDSRTGAWLSGEQVPEPLIEGPVSPDGRWSVVSEGDHLRVTDRRRLADRVAPREEVERRREYLTRLARFDPFWHARQARDAEQRNDPFAAEFHLRLLIQYAPDYLGWHQRRAKTLVALNRPIEAITESKIAERLKSSPPERIAAPHLEPLPPPGPRAKIRFFNPPLPNFDE